MTGLHSFKAITPQAWARYEALRSHPDYWKKGVIASAPPTSQCVNRRQAKNVLPNDRPDCPYCEAVDCISQGVQFGVRVYRCRVCRKYHNDRTRQRITEARSAGEDYQPYYRITPNTVSIECPHCKHQRAQKKRKPKPTKKGWTQQMECKQCKRTFTRLLPQGEASPR